MRKIMSVATAIIMGLTMTACSSNVSDDEVVATVNGKNITAGNYKTTLSLYKQTVEGMYGPSIWDTEIEEGVKYEDQFKDMMLQQMIDVEVVYEEAEKQKVLPTDEELNKALEELKNNMEADEENQKNLEEIGVNDEYLKSQQKQDLAIQNYKAKFDKENQPSEDEMKKYYEDNKEQYYRDEVKASHILISTLDENNKPLSEAKKKEAKVKAEDLLKKVKSGEEFSKLAKENSDDLGSGAQGGDLGFFGKGQMVKPFEDAAFSLEVGNVSDIVESEFGYHIIKVTDKVDEQTPYQEVKDSIKEILLANKFTQQVQKLSKDAKVEKNEEIIKNIKI